MIDFDYLLELLEKADMAAESYCRITTLAYLGMAEAEALRLADLEEIPWRYRRIRDAVGHVQRELRGTHSFVESAAYAWPFWRGFVMGLKGQKLPNRQVSDAFRMGHAIGKNGLR